MDGLTISANKSDVVISPSLICTDMCNLEKSIYALESLGMEWLHIDIIDGRFSPSLPLGIEAVRQLRKRTKINFDVHVMVQNNEFFVQEMLEIGIQQICFHYESTTHTDRLLNLIRSQGVKAGIALNPSTPLAVLDYVLEQCDFLLFMLINPGFAGHKGEKQVPYAANKISDGYRLIRSKNLNIPIEADGRVSLDSIPDLVGAGADILVAGSTSLFIPGNSIEHNLSRMKTAISRGMERRGIVSA